MAEHIMVVDDEAAIADLVEVYLRNEGYAVHKFYCAADALACAESTSLDMAILDVMLPDMDGFTLCQALRKTHLWPIIMLTAKVEDMDKIMGLTLGADDYITKPFNPLELIARVKSQLRRYVQLGTAADAGGASEVLSVGGLALDVHQKRLTVDGEEVKLTPIEYKIMELLMRNQGRVFSIDEIYERVWNEPSFAPENTVAVHIRRIREKIEINPREPKYLKVVWGIGYKIEKA